MFLVHFFLFATSHCVHSYGLGRSLPNGADAIAFPDQDNLHFRDDISVKIDAGYRREPNKLSNDSTMVPINFIKEISGYSVHDLLINYVDDYTDDTLIKSRFGEDDDVERSPAVTPKPANCKPELQTVKLINSSDPTVFYIPMCTRIERCGGCCSHNLLSCQPTETESISFRVIKTQYASGNRLKFVGKEIIHMEKHTKCGCKCKVQATDCNKFQEYNPDECRCRCTNIDEENKCHKNNETKLWDPLNCTCLCREISSCSTGFVFDTNHCKCTPKKRRFSGVATDGQDLLVPAAVYETVPQE